MGACLSALCDTEPDSVPDPGAQGASSAPSAPKASAGPERTAGIAVPRLSIDVFKAATDNFNPAGMLGEGSFGRVYAGEIKGRRVAIKKLDTGSQPDDEFLEGVSTLSQLRHECVPELVAYCLDGPQRALAYELAPMGSLHDILHGRKLAIKTADSDPRMVLTWHQRMTIALGAARGMHYLHEQSNPPVVHKGVKSANVLVFDGCQGKIADFNASNEAPDQASMLKSARVLGTFGYNAPEYAVVGQLTAKSDVYSFGVVLLELLTGRKPVDPNMPRGQQSLVTWATQRDRLSDSKVSSIVDPKMNGEWPQMAVVKFAALTALCVQYDSSYRPSMSTVVRTLTPLARGEEGNA